MSLNLGKLPLEGIDVNLARRIFCSTKVIPQLHRKETATVALPGIFPATSPENYYYRITRCLGVKLTTEVSFEEAAARQTETESSQNLSRVIKELFKQNCVI